MLLERDTDVDTSGADGQTTLLLAAYSGRERIVDMLSKRMQKSIRRMEMRLMHCTMQFTMGMKEQWIPMLLEKDIS